MCIPQTPLYASWCPWVSSGTVVIKHAAASLRPSAVWLHSEVTRCKDTAGDLVHVMTTTNPDFPLLAPVSAFLLLPTSPADTSAIVRMR